MDTECIQINEAHFKVLKSLSDMTLIIIYNYRGEHLYIK